MLENRLQIEIEKFVMAMGKAAEILNIIYLRTI